MTEDRDLVHRVAGLTAGVVALIAVGVGIWAGVEQAAGAVVGGAISIGNFLWLRWTAVRALRPGRAGSTGAWRRAFWIAASGARFGVVGLALGLAVVQAGLGPAGLLVSLLALPVAVVAEGLRAVRAS